MTWAAFAPVCRALLPALAATLAGAAMAQAPKSFPPPARTAWQPLGCRAVSPSAPALASRATWRTLHGDERNSDEVEIAYAPLFAADWVAEPDTWNPTGPVFDSAGNLYVVPFQPHEGVALLSLEPTAGARRWSIPAPPGSPVGSGAPIVLADPDQPGEEIVYQARYDRALAVRTDGSVVWDVATGLPGPPVGSGYGANYHPPADAIVGLTRNGLLYALDRRSGAPLLAAPYSLPGAPAPPGPPSTAPPDVLACAELQFGQLADLQGVTISQAIDTLLGNGVEVANYFSIDAASGRLWVAATAPDAEDGTLDGVSQLGALYGLDLLPDGQGGWQMVEACHRSFSGGSASTPALSADGRRIYVGDNIGTLFAIDADCEVVWSLDVGGQIVGSIAVASDNGELYAATLATIVQVIDGGGSGHLGWVADLDVYTLGPGQVVANQTVAGIGANAISFQAAAALALPTNRLGITTGIGLLDRATGAVRSFSPGLDESVAVMSSGPDGALYMGHSPLRRLFAYCVAELGLVPLAVEPPLGGIRKWASTRPDYGLREALCAAADRATNAQRHRRACPASAAADLRQVQVLVAQSRRAAGEAAARALLPAREATRLARRLTAVDRRLARGRLPFRLLRSTCARIDGQLTP